MNVLAQVFGSIALFLLVISYQQVIRKKFLFIQIFSNVFYSLQYFVLNAYSAVMTTFVTIVELFIFHNDAEKNKKTSIFILLIIEFLLIIIGIFTYNGIYSLIPIFVACIFTYGNFQSNLKITYFIGIVAAILWITYNFIVGAYVSLLGNLFEFLASLTGFIRVFKVSNLDN